MRFSLNVAILAFTSASVLVRSTCAAPIASPLEPDGSHPLHRRDDADSSLSESLQNDFDNLSDGLNAMALAESQFTISLAEVVGIFKTVDAVSNSTGSDSQDGSSGNFSISPALNALVGTLVGELVEQLEDLQTAAVSVNAALVSLEMDLGQAGIPLSNVSGSDNTNGTSDGSGDDGGDSDGSGDDAGANDGGDDDGSGDNNGGQNDSGDSGDDSSSS